MLYKLRQSEFMRVMAFMRPRMWRYGSGMLVMTGLATGLFIVEAFSLKYILDATVDNDLAGLINGLLILLGGVVVSIGLVPIFRYWYNSTSHQTAAEIRLQVFRHAERLPISYFERHHSGDVIARMTTDANLMVDVYTHKLRRFVAPVIFSLGSAAAMLFLDWRIAIVLILFNLLSTYINIRFIKPIRRISDQIQQHMGAMTERSIDLLAGFSILKLFHVQEIILGSYDEVNQNVTDLSIGRRQQEAVLDSINFLLGMISNLGMVVGGAYLIIYDLTEVGNLLALINLQTNLNRALLQSASYLPQVQEALAGASRVFEFFAEPVEPERYQLPDVAKSRAEMIVLQDVTFSYEQTTMVLNKLNIVAEKGQTVALVGPSGGGKSTIIKLLLGFYPLQAGNIMLNGKSLGHYTLEQLRNLVAYVPQDAYLFEGTITENIRYGRLDASPQEIQAAAKAAFAHTFIMEYPEGYDTLVGERGTKLSGGQRQRIAIARAVLKDAPILLLDEATSALDSQSEQWVQQALEALMKDRTTLVIAHRLSTIRHADRIYVIKEGRVVEMGQHLDLMAKGGLYKQLYETQFKSNDLLATDDRVTTQLR